MAAPENHVTSASATPKKPNWVSFRVTVCGIQSVADSVYPRQHDARDHARRDQDPPSHLAHQHEPGGEPPQPGDGGQRYHGEHDELRTVAEQCPQPAQQPP